MLLLKAAEPSLIDINFGLMFWTLFTFVVVLVVLKWYAFGPIQVGDRRPKEAIESDVDAAQTAREEAQSALAEYRQALAESRKEATKILDDARRVSEEQRKKAIAELETEEDAAAPSRQDEIDAETRNRNRRSRPSWPS